MADVAAVMHKDFPRWHAAVALGDDVERRNARWTAVRALAENADRPMVEALVRLAFGTRQLPLAHCLAKIHEAFRGADDTFNPNSATRELQVFAGACLDLLFEQETDVGAAAALSVMTAAFVGARTPNLPLNLVALAEAALARMADANRTRPSLAIGVKAPEYDVAAAIEKVKNPFNGESVAQALASMTDAFKTDLNQLARRQANAIAAVDRFVRVQDEELQMLWWLTGGHSFDLGCAFDGVKAEAQPLVFAKELSDNTTSLPGPRSIKAILVRAGLKERKRLTMVAAINATDSTWLSGLVNQNPSPVTTPLHFAIQRQIETGGGETWVPNWSAVTELDGVRPISPVDLALQFYGERLLVLFE